jgi:hypothetical protein
MIKKNIPRAQNTSNDVFWAMYLPIQLVRGVMHRGLPSSSIIIASMCHWLAALTVGVDGRNVVVHWWS